jgi:hypothetical protein
MKLIGAKRKRRGERKGNKKQKEGGVKAINPSMSRF